MSTPLKRKITLELASKKSTLIKDRPSVFQRLGTKKLGRAGLLTQQHQQQQHQYHSQEGGITGSESKKQTVKRIVAAADEPLRLTSGPVISVLESVTAHARIIKAQLAAKQVQANKSISATTCSNEIISATAFSESTTKLNFREGLAVVAKDGHYHCPEEEEEDTPISADETFLHQQKQSYHSNKFSHQSHHRNQYQHQEYHNQLHPYQKYHQQLEEHHQQQFNSRIQTQRSSHDSCLGQVHSLSSDQSSIEEQEIGTCVSRRARSSNGATGWDQSSLENADQDLLERKREELQYELKLEMDSTSSKKKDARGSELSKKLKKLSGGVSSHHRSQHHQQQHSHHHSLQQQQRDIGHGHVHGHGHGQLQLQQHHTSSSTSESTTSSGSDSSESETSSSSSSSSHDSTHRRLKKRSHALAGRTRRGESSSSSGTGVAATAVGTVSSAGSSTKISKKHAKKLAAVAAAASHEQSERSKRMAKSKGGVGSGNGNSTLLTKSIRMKRLHPVSPNGVGGGVGSGGSSGTHHVSRKVSREISPSGKVSSSSSSKYAITKAKLLSSSSSSSKKEKISAIVARERVRVKERELALREKERDLALREKEREREKERLRLREREIRERLGKMRPTSPPRMRAVVVSPVSSRGGGGGGSLQGKGKKSPERRLSSPMSSRYREMLPMRRERTPELARDEHRRSHEALKERERRVREVLRSKEREDALSRCQDRQRERDRISLKEQHQQPQPQQHLHAHQHPHQHPQQHQQHQQPQQQQQQQQQQLPQARNLRRDNDGGLEKPDRHRPVERLLPRPAERARALAAARSPGKSLDRDRSRSPGSPGRRGLRDRERSYDRSSYMHDMHERRTSSRSREREYTTAHGPPHTMRPSRRDCSPPHYERHGTAMGRDSTGGGGIRMEYRAERDELAYVDSRIGPMGGSRVERGSGSGPGRDEYVVREYPDDSRRDQHHDRAWDCDPSSRADVRGGGGVGGRYDRGDISGGREGAGDWSERGGDSHQIDPDGPYLGSGSGSGRGGEPRTAWDDRRSWKDGLGESWHSVSERDIPDRGMQEWKYKERQWEHEHGERTGASVSGSGGCNSIGGGSGASAGGAGGAAAGGGAGGGHGHGGHSHVGHGGSLASSRRSWQQTNNVGTGPTSGAGVGPGGNGGSSGGVSGGPAGDWLGSKGDHERDFMSHQRPNDRLMFRRHHHQGPYHGHPRKPHLGSSSGGGGSIGGTGNTGGLGSCGMNRFTPNKYSLNRTQERLAPGIGLGGGGSGQTSHLHAQSHRQTQPAPVGSGATQQPSVNHHHSAVNSVMQQHHQQHQQQQQQHHQHHQHHHHHHHHRQQQQPQPQQQQQQQGSGHQVSSHRLAENVGGAHELHPNADVSHQHHQQQPQFAAHQQHPLGPGSSAAQLQQTHRNYDIPAVAGDLTPGPRRLDPPASPTPEGDSSFAITPSTQTCVPLISSPNLLASSPLDTGTDSAIVLSAPVGLAALDTMEVDNLSEISDDADEILMRDEDLATNQLCDSISTDRSADSQQAELMSHEPDLEQNTAAAMSKGSLASPPNEFDANGTVIETENVIGVGLPPTNYTVAARDGNRSDGVSVKGYRCEADQPQIGRDAGKLHANKELKEEMDLDFEEISDGELEAEENRGKAGLGDPLGVDWGSLTQEVLHPLKHTRHRQHSQQFPVSARNRWKAHHVLLEIGISVRLAGASYAQRVLTESKERLREELEEFRSSVAADRAEMIRRTTPTANVLQDQGEKSLEIQEDTPRNRATDEEAESDGTPLDISAMTNGRPDVEGRDVKMERNEAHHSMRIKTESPEHTTEPAQPSGQQPAPSEWKVDGCESYQKGVTTPGTIVSNIERDLDEMDRILHPIASVHVALRERSRIRRNLILTGEPVEGQQHQCGRALNARKDLQIRRQLCGFPPLTMVTMTACAAGSATGFLHQELLADARLGGGGGTIQTELRADIRQMYNDMTNHQRQLQQSLGISATLPAV